MSPLVPPESVWTSQLPGCISDPHTVLRSPQAPALRPLHQLYSLSPGTIRRTGGVSFCLALFRALSWGASRAGLPLG